MKKTNMAIFAVLLAGLFFMGCEDEIKKDIPIPPEPEIEGLLILQAYGTGDGGGAGISHSFVELYNTGNTAIDLSGYTLWFAAGTRPAAAGGPIAEKDGTWKHIELSGQIPAGGSFLILGDNGNADTAFCVISDTGDMNIEDFNLSNRSFKIALIKGTVVLTDDIQNPFDIDGNGKKVEGYIDMVGVRNDGNHATRPDQILGFEKAPARNSASEAVRRNSLIDTDNNQGYNADQAPNGSGDFTSIRYNGMSAADFELFKPRNSSAGKWEPFHPLSSAAIGGANISAGELTIMNGMSVTLTAQIAPANADLGGITYKWQVTEQSPAGTLTFTTTNAYAFEITGAVDGSALVTLTVSGGKIPSPGITDSINVIVASAPHPSTTILILQANTHGNANSPLGSGFPKSAVELYNMTDAPINLDTGNYYLHVGTAAAWTHAVKLTGTIPAKASYLVVSDTVTVNATPRAEFPTADQYVDIEDIANDNFKIAVLKNRSDVLTVANPFTELSMTADYVDMFGAGTAAAEGAAFSNSGRPRVGRRASLIDTNNNNTDFVLVDYTNAGQTANPIDLNKVWPRNTADGAWDPIAGTPIKYQTDTSTPPDSVKISGTGVSGGELTIMNGSSATLSAQFAPANAETEGLTYTWQVTEQTPAGTLTFTAANTPTFSITGAVDGTAKVTLTVNGEKLPAAGLKDTINVTVASAPLPSTTIIILQANTYGNDNSPLGSGFPRSAVELYNLTDLPINLDTGNYYLHIGTAAAWTHAVKLTGTIPAKASYLVVSNTGIANATPRAEFPTADQNVDIGDINNNNFKVAILRNRAAVLTVVNPFTELSMTADYVDMFGGGSAAAEGTAFSNTGRPRVGRRASLTDTNNNNADFVAVDYTDAGQTANPIDLNKVWPRNASDGAWDPIAGTPIKYSDDPVDEGKLLILQAYGTGTGGGSGISHSFVELYNISDAAIDLTGYSLWYAEGTRPAAAGDPIAVKDGVWKQIALSGQIPSEGSFLVLGDNNNAATASQVITYTGDINNNTFNLGNRSFKVALIKGTAVLTDDIQNPFDTDGNGKKIAGYIDMVGARNDGAANRPDQILGFEKAPARNSASEAVRRNSLTDTDNNQGYNAEQAPTGTGDFTSIRYNGMSASDFELFKPRSASMGKWSPFALPNSLAISGTGVSAGELTVKNGDTVTLSAQLSPANAETGGLTYTWQVTEQTPAGTLTFTAANIPALAITGAVDGTAKVTLTVSGGKIPAPGLTSSVDVSVATSSGTERLLILQANRRGNDNGQAGGFPRTLVELYNNTNSAINLSTGNYYLHFGNASNWLSVIKLEGTVGAKRSFLIVSNNATEVNPGSAAVVTAGKLTEAGRAVLPAADQTADFSLGTANNWKVALMRNQSTLLTVANPFGDSSLTANYIDMLGTGSANGREGGTAGAASSQPQGPRRKSLTDTDVNFDDFTQADYRGLWTTDGGLGDSRTANADLYKYWPRNSSAGTWDPITGLPAVHPTVINPITGAVEFPVP